MKWHKINWDKIQKILDDTVNSEKDDSVTRFFITMSNNSKMKMDKNGNLPESFTWELGYKAKLPLENGEKYLCYFKDGDYFEICTYDDGQDFEPAFWNEGYTEICYPDYWTEIVSPVR